MNHAIFGSADAADELLPDPKMDSASQAFADSLTAEQIALIDVNLLSHAAANWRKSARVVGSCLMGLPDSLRDIHVDFLSQRLKHLIDEGRLVHQGDLNRLRYCEVRRSSSDPACH